MYEKGHVWGVLFVKRMINVLLTNGNAEAFFQNKIVYIGLYRVNNRWLVASVPKTPSIQCILKFKADSVLVKTYPWFVYWEPK